ncbi:MAG: hypothetical protein WC551_11880 [Patescibacteria group bacterium]
MAKIDDGGPAFSRPESMQGNCYAASQDGISFADLIAALVVAGIHAKGEKKHPDLTASEFNRSE